MKKFVRFEWGRFYPQGGLHDMTGSYETLEEAQAQEYKPFGDHYDEPAIQIIDRDTWEVVWASGDGDAEY